MCVASFPLLSLFFLFWVFEYVHAELRSLYPLSIFDAFYVTKKIPGSPRLHNFNVCVPKCGSLGTRLFERSLNIISCFIIHLTHANVWKPCSCTQFIKSYFYYKSHKNLYQVLQVMHTTPECAISTKLYQEKTITRLLTLLLVLLLVTVQTTTNSWYFLVYVALYYGDNILFHHTSNLHNVWGLMGKPCSCMQFMYFLLQVSWESI